MFRAWLITGYLGMTVAWAQAPELDLRIPRQRVDGSASIQGRFLTESGHGLGGVSITVRNLESGQTLLVATSGDGVVRLLNLQPGKYSLQASMDGFQRYEETEVLLRAGDVHEIQVRLIQKPVETAPAAAPPTVLEAPYRTLPRPGDSEASEASGDVQRDEKVFAPAPDRWRYRDPDYHRYGSSDEALFVKGRLLDPFNRNKLKGDYPIFGKQTFFNFGALSDTFLVSRRLPIPSGLGSAEPYSEEFFGRMDQFAYVQRFAFTFDLTHGDSAYRPADWRIRFTPEINVNFVKVRENGILNIDVREGTTRLDAHLGLQEAFVEKRLLTLSNNFDFLSARLGIQTFNSDFRGFVFLDQQPGARLFGNLKANRYQYNAAYFAMLEKDTNSGLNTMQYRDQQVFVANVYRQDFIRLGYNIQASFHYNKDEPSTKFDNNNFIARPAPIGRVQPHAIRAFYYGLTGDGHVGRYNISHAFYQVLGHDSLNQLAGRRTDINAQMAAVEISRDKNWLRAKTSFFWASGDKNPRDDSARGFDSIVDHSNFAGGFFSFWNREGIRLTGTGVGLVGEGSLLPSLRSSTLQGQANFVNPGIFIFNGALEAEVTPKIRGFLNLNFIRFHRPEVLELLLFQKPIHSGVGADSGIGVLYRPPLTENLVISCAFNTFKPFQGFSDIYTDRILYSVAAHVKFRF